MVDRGDAVFLGSPVGNLPTISSVLRGKLQAVGDHGGEAQAPPGP